jgi:hypothetical protein
MLADVGYWSKADMRSVLAMSAEVVSEICTG